MDTLNRRQGEVLQRTLWNALAQAEADLRAAEHFDKGPGVIAIIQARVDELNDLRVALSSVVYGR